MKVRNRKCIRRLSNRTFWASRRRNLIAACAIVLTTLLFTSLFTIAMSLNASYEIYQFRQVGGTAHGTFKDVTKEQQEAITAHEKVKETGARTVIGFCMEGVFAKLPAEISYMDENCTKWSFAEPQEGRMPQSGREVSMDTASLKLLGVEPKIGAQVPLTYTVGDKEQKSFEVSETFTLAGWWEFDQMMPVHYINISEEYKNEIEQKGIEAGMEAFRTDLNVMMGSSMDIRGQMEQVDTDLGYTWDRRDGENSVRIGVNWGYTSAQLGSGMDKETLLAIAAFLLLIIFTGYLIIYNIFQISVSSDIRYYGLLKTIGTTPRQIRRIIRHQALYMCLMGIPFGLLFGYGIGSVLTPVILKTSALGSVSTKISTSPLIFAASALFAVLTVLFSSARPGRMAGKVSPVEAVRYTDALHARKKSRRVRGAKVHQMAFANLGRNKSKTLLVVLSLAFSVTLLNELYMFVNGFDIEKYVSSRTCADFIVSTTDYFRFQQAGEYITGDDIAEISGSTNQSLSGCGYKLSGAKPRVWLEESIMRANLSRYNGEEMADEILASMEKKDGRVTGMLQAEGLDESLIEKLQVIEGSLEAFSDPDSHAIAAAVMTDDYGKIINREECPDIGDTLTVIYAEDAYMVDSRTGEKADETTPEEFMEYYMEGKKEINYTVCALVNVPYSMSFRYAIAGGITAILPAERMKKDSGQEIKPVFYLFDTPDAQAEADAERYLAKKTAGDLSVLMYESKQVVREHFEQFRQVFLLIGGVLCAVIGMVGMLNFFNAVMTGILSRRREFAVLQSVGMTNRQLRAMLVYEGLFYVLSSAAMAFVLSLALGPLTGMMLEKMFWFFGYRFTLLPVLGMVPVFALLGFAIPAVLYGQSVKHSVVQRLREAE